MILAKNAEHQEISALTREARDSLSPSKAIRLLKEGNKRFVGNLKLNRNLLQQINETSVEQHPFAFVLSSQRLTIIHGKCQNTSYQSEGGGMCVNVGR